MHSVGHVELARDRPSLRVLARDQRAPVRSSRIGTESVATQFALRNGRPISTAGSVETALFTGTRAAAVVAAGERKRMTQRTR